MARKAAAKVRSRSEPAVTPRAPPRVGGGDGRASHIRREVAGIALVLCAVFLAGALIFHGRPSDRCWSGGGVFGPVGSCLRQTILYFVGLPTAFLIPLIPAVHALRLFGRMRASADRSWLVFFIGVAVLLPVLLGVALGAHPERSVQAGLWGSFAAFYLVRAFGMAGAWVILVLGVSALMAATLAWNPLRIIVGHGTRTVVARDDPPVASDVELDRGGATSLAVALAPAPSEMAAVDPTVAADLAMPETASSVRKRGSRGPSAAERAADVAAEIGAAARLGDVEADELPPTDLLNPPPAQHADVSKRELDAMGAKLLEALRTFRVDGELVGRTTGPVVTQFEIVPAAGVKVRQIANLANDLALAMRAPSIRIVAPIPGKGAVGVEVPNPIAEIVSFREVLESNRVSDRSGGTADRVGEGPRGASRGRGSREDAAFADRGGDRVGEVGVREYDHYESGVSPHAGDAAVPDGRPEDGRVIGL